MGTFDFFDGTVAEITSLGDQMADGSEQLSTALNKGWDWFGDMCRQAAHDAAYQFAQATISARRSYQQVHDDVLLEVSPSEMGAAFDYDEETRAVETSFDTAMKGDAGTAAKQAVSDIRSTTGFDIGVNSIVE